MARALEQFNRVKRAATRVRQNRDRILDEYEDDVWCFFQNCWHLKDWVANDTTNGVSKAKVEAAVNSVETLVICGDMANRSKHLTLDPNRRNTKDADVASRNTNVFASMAGGNGYGELDFEVVVDDGRRIHVIQLTDDCVEEWEKLPRSFGVSGV